MRPAGHETRLTHTRGFARKYGRLLIVAWTVMVASFLLTIYDLRQEVLREAATEARAHLELNLAYRKVIASFSGVYVPAGTMPPIPISRSPTGTSSRVTGSGSR